MHIFQIAPCKLSLETISLSNYFYLSVGYATPGRFPNIHMYTLKSCNVHPLKLTSHYQKAGLRLVSSPSWDHQPHCQCLTFLGSVIS